MTDPQPVGPALVQIIHADWLAGFDAGEAGQPSDPLPAGRDGLSWISGWIEGDAKRRGFKASRGKPR